VAADPEIQKTGKQHADVSAALASVGFDEEMMAKPITGISGGWKMKLALTRWAPPRGFARRANAAAAVLLSRAAGRRRRPPALLKRPRCSPSSLPAF
jgi:hypothetical protein